MATRDFRARGLTTWQDIRGWPGETIPGAELCIPRSAVPRSTVTTEIVLKREVMTKKNFEID